MERITYLDNEGEIRSTEVTETISMTSKELEYSDQNTTVVNEGFKNVYVPEIIKWMREVNE